jgi:CRP-like cAMP-binding protein
MMMNNDKIKNYISQIILLKDEEWRHLFNFIEIKTLHKNDLFLKQSQICDSIAFVNYGTLIYYKLLDSVDEITTDFAFEGDWVTDNQSRLNHLPSFINIKAIEETELFIIKEKNLPDLYESIPKLEKLGRILMEQAFIKISQHSIDLQVLSAKERYLKLLKKYPEVFQKIPLYHIANYLGIAPKSLSRIRKEISHI